MLLVFETPCIDCGGGPCQGHVQGVLEGFEAPSLRPPMRPGAQPPIRVRHHQPRLM